MSLLEYWVSVCACIRYYSDVKSQDPSFQQGRQTAAIREMRCELGHSALPPSPFEMQEAKVILHISTSVNWVSQQQSQQWRQNTVPRCSQRSRFLINSKCGSLRWSGEASLIFWKSDRVRKFRRCVSAATKGHHGPSDDPCHPRLAHECDRQHVWNHFSRAENQLRIWLMHGFNRI